MTQEIANAAFEAVASYLESELGRDAPEPVAVRLKRLPWHVLLAGRTPEASDVHLLREIIERNRQRRAQHD